MFLHMLYQQQKFQLVSCFGYKRNMFPLNDVNFVTNSDRLSQVQISVDSVPAACLFVALDADRFEGV